MKMGILNWLETRRSAVLGALTAFLVIGVATAALYARLCGGRTGSEMIAMEAMAKMNYEQGQYPEAIQLYARLVTERLQYTALKFYLGKSFYKNKQYAEAERQFQSVLTEEPDYPPALFNLGASQYRQGKTAEAHATFTRFAKNYAAYYPQQMALISNLTQKMTASTDKHN